MKNYKAVLYSAVIYSVIIGVVYVTYAILALLSRWCVLEMTGGPLVYMMFLLYFRVETCEATVQWDLLGVQSQQNVVMPAETDAVQRTFVFVVVYLGLHAALIVTALYGLCGVNNSCLGRKSFLVFIAPWAIVWVAIIVLDVLASVYFIIDLISATSASEGLSQWIMDMLEVVNRAEVQQSFQEVAWEVKFFPPFLMLLGTSKAFLFLLVNVVWLVLIVKAGWTASTYHKYLDQTRRNYENTMANVNPAFEGMRDDTVAQKQHERQMGFIASQSSLNESIASTTNPSAPPNEAAETRYIDTSRVQAAAYPYQKQQQRQQPQQMMMMAAVEEEPDYKLQRPNTLVLPERPRSQQQQQQQQRPFYVEPDYEVDNRLSRYQENNGNVIRSVEPLNDIPEQQQSNTRIRVLPPVAQVNRQQSEPRPQVARAQSELRQKPLPPPKPHTNRYSMQPSGGSESPVLYRPERATNSNPKIDRSSSSIRAPDELRNQLPWSYFKPKEEAAPRRAFENLDENEEKPAVPVPDYTLHYGRRERAKLSDSDGDGSWAHQRY